MNSKAKEVEVLVGGKILPNPVAMISDASRAARHLSSILVKASLTHTALVNLAFFT